jgi:hypothetical protein
MTVDEMECIEKGGTEHTIALLRRLAAALDADARLTAGHDLGLVWFEPTQPDLISRGVSGQKAVTIGKAEVTLLPARPARCGEAEIEWRGQVDLLAVGAVGRHLIPLPAFG